MDVPCNRDETSLLITSHTCRSHDKESWMAWDVGAFIVVWRSDHLRMVGWHLVERRIRNLLRLPTNTGARMGRGEWETSFLLSHYVDLSLSSPPPTPPLGPELANGEPMPNLQGELSLHPILPALRKIPHCQKIPILSAKFSKDLFLVIYPNIYSHFLHQIFWWPFLVIYPNILGGPAMVQMVQWLDRPWQCSTRVRSGAVGL